MLEERIQRIPQERQELAKKLNFFDCNVWLCRSEGFPLAQEIPPQRVSEVLDERLITGGSFPIGGGKASLHSTAMGPCCRL
jgi:hypothetical protein